MMKLIFIACDTSKLSKAKKIIDQTKTHKLDIGYKFGLEFFFLKKDVNLFRKLEVKKYF